MCPQGPKEEYVAMENLMDDELKLNIDAARSPRNADMRSGLLPSGAPPSEGSPVKSLYTTASSDEDLEHALQRWPTMIQMWEELKKQRPIGLPVAVMNVMWFARFIISTMFLGRLGSLQLAGGTMALTFANVTGFSVLMGLAGGMEPICGQAYGARRYVDRSTRESQFHEVGCSVGVGMFFMAIAIQVQAYGRHVAEMWSRSPADERADLVRVVECGEGAARNRPRRRHRQDRQAVSALPAPGPVRDRGRDAAADLPPLAVRHEADDGVLRDRLAAARAHQLRDRVLVPRGRPRHRAREFLR
jgi:hypothetical protein